MPDYKKKKVKKHIVSKNKPKTVKKHDTTDENIEMKPRNKAAFKPQKKSKLNVIKGNKLRRIRKTRIFLASLAVIVVAAIILSVALPIGIMDSVNNLLSVLGNGTYPYELMGTQTLNTVSAGNYYYVLTDTNVNIRSNNGKEILTLQHGFEKPVIRVTSTRILAFDQGGKNLFVANLQKKTNEKTFEEPILNAAISRSGTYAVAYNADNYASVVSVFNKNDKLLYEWYSSEETVNNVVLSPNGEKVAVSTITASGGKLRSKLYVFEYDSANPVYTLDLGEELVYSLDGGIRSGFTVILKNGFKYIKWSKYSAVEYNTDLQLSNFKSNSNIMVAVTTLAGNKGDNKIAVFNRRGKLISEFNYNGIISDIQISRNHIYCMSETIVSIYSKEGELLRTAECKFGAVRLAVLSAYSVAVIGNDSVKRLEIKK